MSDLHKAALQGIRVLVTLILLGMTAYAALLLYVMGAWWIDDGNLPANELGWYVIAAKRWFKLFAYTLVYTALLLPVCLFTQPLLTWDALRLNQTRWGKTPFRRTALMLIPHVVLLQCALLVGVVKFLIEKPWF